MMLREDAVEGKRVPTFRSFGVQISADTGREIRFRAARTPSVRSFVRYEARHSLLSTGFSFRCSNKNPRDAATRFNRVERRIDAARGTRCRSRIATGEKLSMKHVFLREKMVADGSLDLMKLSFDETREEILCLIAVIYLLLALNRSTDPLFAMKFLKKENKIVSR